MLKVPHECCFCWSWLAILDLKLTDKLINDKVNLHLFTITVICITIGYLVNPIVHNDR